MENVENTSGEVTPESESEDPWQAAEDKFDSLVAESKEEAEISQEVEQKAESHIEQKLEDVPDYLKLDDLKVPHKYKDEVKARIQKVVSDFEEKKKTDIESVNNESGKYKEAVTSLVDIFKQIAQTPKEELPYKIAGLVDQYGESIGLDKKLAENFRTEKQTQSQSQELQTAQALQLINKKYSERMALTQDPKEFMSLWEEADIEKSKVLESQLMSKVASLLGLYHDKYIAPDKKTLEEYKTKSQEEAVTNFYNKTSSAWENAAKDLNSQYKDFKNYLPKISQIIKSQKAFSAAKDELNKNPDDVEGRRDFIKSIYFAVSRNESKMPEPSEGGLPPSQKHIQTKKTGGGNWDDALEAFLAFK